MGASAVEDVIDVTNLMKRRFAWDVLPCPMVPGFLSHLGLLPGSEGGNNLEHRQSHVRMAQVEPIIGTVTTFSRMAARSAATAILEGQGLVGVEDSDPKMEHYLNLVTTCTAAVIANLIDNGVIHLNVGETEE